MNINPSIYSNSYAKYKDSLHELEQIQKQHLLSDNKTSNVTAGADNHADESTFDECFFMKGVSESQLIAITKAWQEHEISNFDYNYHEAYLIRLRAAT